MYATPVAVPWSLTSFEPHGAPLLTPHAFAWTGTRGEGVGNPAFLRDLSR